MHLSKAPKIFVSLFSLTNMSEIQRKGFKILLISCQNYNWNSDVLNISIEVKSQDSDTSCSISFLNDNNSFSDEEGNNSPLRKKKTLQKNNPCKVDINSSVVISVIFHIFEILKVLFLHQLLDYP